MTPNTIHDYITSEETNYTLPVQVIENWDWGMKEHIATSVLYKNSTFTTGKDLNRPFKNITRPILNVQYRAEGFDVKDIQLFVDSHDEYYKSFLIRKFHEKWAREQGIDTFIDELVESYVDFGGVLVKDVNGARPEVVPLQSIAFCDQTDILSGPIGLKHFFSPDQLKEMEVKGWGKEEKGATVTIDEVIALAETSKVKDKTQGRVSKTPGKYIEIYEVHGTFPETFYKLDGDPEKYVTQLHITTFYTTPDGQKHGVTLYAGKETTSPFKFLARDKIYGRALGLGGVEELFQPQIWTNYSEIAKKDMLDAASKVVFVTTDPTFKTKNNIRNMENMEVVDIQANTSLEQLNSTPVNIALFEKSVIDWETHAQRMGAANDAIMGESPSAGTPFKLQELVTAESHGLHEYRKGKLATFVDEIYRDWIIPHLAREIAKGSEFLAELSMDELQEVADAIVACQVNETVKEKILSGQMIDPAELDKQKELIRSEFMRGGSKRFLAILENEMKDAPMDVYTNIAGKQKNMAGVVDKLVNVFRTIVSNPAVLSQPSMAKLFNEILENSGLSPLDFSGFAKMQPLQAGAQLSTDGQPTPLTI